MVIVNVLKRNLFVLPTHFFEKIAVTRADTGSIPQNIFSFTRLFLASFFETINVIPTTKT